MTCVAAAICGDRREAIDISGITDVVHKSPRAIERGRSEIVLVPSDGIAGRVANAAVDAFDALVGGNARRSIGRNFLDLIRASFGRGKHSPGSLPFLEKHTHVRCEIFDDGQVFERADFKPAVFRYL